jgi:Kef-type K+ transport system membrane component KefB
VRRGAALPIVLFTLALASALSVGGLYVARKLATATRTSQRGADLELVAEGVLVMAVANWDSAQRTTQPIGSTAQLATASEALSRATGWITRTAELDYWVVAEAQYTAKPLLRRRLGLVLRSEKGYPKPSSPRAWAELP